MMLVLTEKLLLAQNIIPSFNRWVTLTVAAVLVLVIFIGAFRGSKRGHQD